MAMDRTKVLTAFLVNGAVLAASTLAYRNLPPNPAEARLRQIDEKLAKLDAASRSKESEAEARIGAEARTGAEARDEAKVGTEGQRDEISVGCLPCARAHLATIAGTLKEALRFAREDERGMEHPEVQSRLQAAEEDVTIIERHDWTPEKILRSPEEQQDIIRDMLPGLRTLRQDIMRINSVESLEQAAAGAAKMSVELRLAVLALNGVDVQKAIDLAKRIQSGELTLEQAKRVNAGQMTLEEAKAETKTGEVAASGH